MARFPMWRWTNSKGLPRPKRNPLKTNWPWAMSFRHLRKFSPSILRTTKRTMPVTMTKVADPRITTEKMTTLMTENGEEEDDDHRALWYVPRHRINQSRFQRIWCLCVPSCLWKEDFEWIGTTGVPPHLKWSQYPKRRRRGWRGHGRWRINFQMKIESQIRHPFITGEDNDRPIAEGQDYEQETNDDDGNASHKQWRRHQHHARVQITNPIRALLLSSCRLLAKKGLKRIIDTQYVDTESSHLDFYTGKIDRNSQSTSSEKRAEFDRRCIYISQWSSGYFPDRQRT